MSRRVLAAACGLAAAAGLAFAPSARADHGVPIDVLLAGNRIVTVSSADPSTATSDVVVDGLQGDEALVGIDYRPSDGRLYGVGRGATSTGLYVIEDGAATRVANLHTGGVNVVLSGTSFGVDVNPAANALRIVSDDGQNLRVTPAGFGLGGNLPTGATLVDGRLSEVPCSPANSNPPTCANPRAPYRGIVGAAYTNNDADGAPPAGTGTTLLTLDAVLDRVNTQNPPNDGTQQALGSLGLATTGAAGFDIRSEIGVDGKAIAGQDVAYALLTQETGRSGAARLVTIDLATGAATELGALGRFRAPIGMAVGLDG